MRCIRMELGEPDDSGRRRPLPVKGSEFEFETDQVVFAIGTNANPIIGQTSKLKLNKRGYIATDDNLATSMAGVFAGGDIVTGAATVIEAMGAGRKAARSMKQFLRIRDAGRRGLAGRQPVRHRPARAQFRARPRRLRTTNPMNQHVATATLETRRQPGNGQGRRHPGGARGRDHQRLGRGRAALRPVARRHRGAHGQRRVDGRDHPGRDPAAGAQRRRRERQPHPPRLEPRHQRRQRDRPGGRLQRAGAARAGAGPRAQARLHHPARKHVAGQSRQVDRRLLRRRRTTSWSRPATGSTRSRWSASAGATSPIARRGKNMFALGMLCSIYSLDLQLARDQIALTFGKKDASVIKTNVKLLDAGYAVGRGQSRLQVPHPGGAQRGAADRHQRQHRAGARRARLGHGDLRHVSDHAGHLGVALSQRHLRAGRRHRAPGRGRDRRLRVRDRRLLRRQVHRHDHVRARATRSSRRRSGSPSWARSRWSSSTCSAAGRAPASRPRRSRATC